MPDEEIEQNPEDSEKKPAKKKGRLKSLVLITLVLALLGGGGFFYWRYRAAAKAKAAEAHKTGEGEKPSSAEGKDEAEVKEIIELQPFIVNLADQNDSRYLRITISLGVGESTEAKVDPLFTTRVRNAILATITNKRSDQVLTIEGKTVLRKEILEAARSAVTTPAVHAVYITDFIVQM